MKSYSCENNNYVIILDKTNSKVSLQVWDKRLPAKYGDANYPHIVVNSYGVKCRSGILDTNPELNREVVGLAVKSEILRRRNIYNLELSLEDIFKICASLGFGINSRDSIMEVFT